MDNFTVLFPGAMKPFHDGHMSIIYSYAKLKKNRPDHIELIISPKERCGVPADITLNFLKCVNFKKINNKGITVGFQIASKPHVFGVCVYIICHSSYSSKFCLAASTKGDDYSRVELFYQQFMHGEKYKYANRLYDVRVNNTPLLYKDRTDEYNGKPVSASVARMDVVNNDFENFKTSYTRMLNSGMVTESQLHDYFVALKDVVINDANNISKLNDILAENYNDKLNIKTNIKYQMKRRLNEGISSVDTINVDITEMSKDFPEMDFNALRDAMIDAGAEVDGNEDSEAGKLYMVIDGITLADVESVMDDFGVDNGMSYVVGSNDVVDSIDEADIDADFPSYDEVGIDEDIDDELIEDEPFIDEDFEDAEFDETMMDEDDDLAYPDYDDVVIDEEDDLDYPDYDDVVIDDVYMYESLRNRRRSSRTINEKKKPCCPGNGGRPGSRMMVPLSEAVKLLEETPKTKKQLDKHITTIKDIIADINKPDLSAGDIKNIYDKLANEKKQLKSHKLIGSNEEQVTLKDFDGVKTGVKKLSKLSKTQKPELTDKIDALLESKVINALKAKKKYLYENVNINGKNLKQYSIAEIKKMLLEAFNKKNQLTYKLKNSLNESLSVLEKRNVKEDLAKSIKLLNILDDELTYRTTVNECLAKLNEAAVIKKEEKTDDNKSEETKTDDNKTTDNKVNEDDNNITSDDNQNDNQDNSSEENNDENSDNNEENNDENSDENSDDNAEEVELSRIKITLASEDAANDLKQSCISAGIPEEAIEIETGDSDDESDSEEGDDAQNEGVRFGRYKNIRALFEDDLDQNGDDQNGESGDDADSADSFGGDENNSDESDDSEEEGNVVLVLTNTDYINDLAGVLADEYGIEQEEFEEMIGGEIVSNDDEGEATENDDENSSDENSDDSSSDNDEPEDTIDPNDIFAGL